MKNKIKTFIGDNIFRTRFYAKKTFGEVEKIRTALEKTSLEFAFHMQERQCWDRATQERCRTIFSRIQPVNLSAGKVRVGKEFDGGYVVPSDWAKIRHLHSFGVGSDNSFEICFAQAGAEVHCYDHSVPSLPQPHSNIHLFQKKVVGVPGDSPDEIAWNDIVREVPEEPSALKMDIEGFEFQCLAVASQSQLQRYAFINLEIHEVAESLATSRQDRIANLLEILTEGFHCFHVHANNEGGGRLLGGAFVPNLLEVSLANKKYYPLGKQANYDVSLDQPNNPQRPDIWCGYL